MNFFQSIYLTRFSKPVENRKIYRAVWRIRPTAILEFGIQRGERSVSLLELAKRFHRPNDIQYCCVDPFESRTTEDGPGLSLRKAYKMLSKTGVRVQTVPGMPVESLRHVVGSIRQVDLLIVATPSNHWVFEHRDTLLEQLGDQAALFIGNSSPNGKPFEWSEYSVAGFRDATSSMDRTIRRAA